MSIDIRFPDLGTKEKIVKGMSCSIETEMIEMLQRRVALQRISVVPVKVATSQLFGTSGKTFGAQLRALIVPHD